MAKRKQRGGSKASFNVPKPLVYTFPHGVGTARDAAIQRQTQDADMLTAMNNHTHGDGSSQKGGGDCQGGHVPLPPTHGVQLGPGHMNPNVQTAGNYNSSCQAQANRVFDSLVPKPPPVTETSQNGGKRRRKTHKRRNRKRKTHKRRTYKKRSHKKRSHKRRK